MHATNFVSASDRARTAIAFLYVSMAMEFVVSGTTLARLLRNQTVEPDLPETAMWCVYLVAALTGFVFFLKWMYRSYANLPALGAARLKFTPGWAVGSFFVPFVNLIHPLYAMREIWHHSRGCEPYTLRSAHGWPVPLLGLWWGAHVTSNLLGNMSFRASMNASAAEQAQAGQWLSVASGVAGIAASLLVIEIIRKIDAFQSARHAQQAAR